MEEYRGERYREPQRVARESATSQRESQGSMEGLNEIQRWATTRTQRYHQIRNAHAGARPYMPDGPTPPKVVGRLRHIAQMLQGNPQILQDLQDVHSDDPSRITMAVIPDFPFSVIARCGDSEPIVLAPALTCTDNAIKDLFSRQPRHVGQYDIFTSFNELMERAWKMAEENPESVLTYNRESMKPEDYVALAAEGVLYNELFRLPLSKLKQSA